MLRHPFLPFPKSCSMKLSSRDNYWRIWYGRWESKEKVTNKQGPFNGTAHLETTDTDTGSTVEREREKWMEIPQPPIMFGKLGASPTILLCSTFWFQLPLQTQASAVQLPTCLENFCWSSHLECQIETTYRHNLLLKIQTSRFDYKIILYCVWMLCDGGGLDIFKIMNVYLNQKYRG